MQQGSELRTIMREVSKLRAALKPSAAQAKLESAETGKAPGKRIIDQRAGELADLLFKCGGLETTRAVLARLMAYYDTALFTKKAVPEAEGYSGSMENHCHVGLCKDTETAERDGPLQVTATIG